MRGWGLQAGGVTPSWLALVERELRVRARKADTYWVRVVAVVIALLILGWMLLVQGLSPLGSGGATLFGALCTLGFVWSLLEGVRTTADCISSEKRDGTLGLLFLTHLNSRNLVLGKLVAAGLASFYGVLAMVPVLALTLLPGGVTAGEVVRMALVLINTLWVALACGLVGSARSRERSRAWMGTLLVLGLVMFGPLVLAGLPGAVMWLMTLLAGVVTTDALRLGPLVRWLAAGSPIVAFGHAFASTYARDPALFWFSLGFTHGLGWAGVVLASLTLARQWAEETVGPAASSLTLPRRPNRRLDALTRTRMLTVNPAWWLAARQAGLRWWAWALAGVYCLSVLQWVVGLPFSGTVRWTWPVTVGLLLGFYFTVALDACRLITEARQSGALELLLVSPLSQGQLLCGQWRALCHRHLGPALLLVSGIGLNMVAANWRLVTGQTANPDMVWFMWGQLLNQLLGVGLTLVTVVLVGQWLALRLKKPVAAPAWTVALTFLAPWALRLLFTGPLAFLFGTISSGWPWDFLLVVVCCTQLPVVALIIWAWRGLSRDWRPWLEAAAHG